MLTEQFPRITLAATLIIALGRSALATDPVVVEQPASAGSIRKQNGECVAGSSLVRLETGGSRTILTPEFNGACDPSVSFDGGELLFSGRKSETGTWQVWKMDLREGGVVQITDLPGNAFAPIWVGSIFHLDDEKPTRRIAFLATGTSGRRLPALHTANLDGSDVLRISYAPEGDLPPDVLPNGRIVYPTLARAGGFQTSLMALNIDGTDLAAFADPHEKPGYSHAVRVGNDGDVYFVEADERGRDGGALASVSLRRPLRSRRVIATTEEGLFLDPAPMSDGSLLGSFLARGSTSYVLVRIAHETGRVVETVERRDGVHVLDAQEIVPRPVVPGRSTVVDTRQETGVFFCLSSRITDRPSLAHLRDGHASKLRVIAHQEHRDLHTLERVLGEAPVETDGSFHIEVPARTPVRFQLLDAEEHVLGEQQSWTWVMPREWRGCIGCHENREMVAPNILADAVVKPAVPVGIDPQTTGAEK
jgi:hypothetical protein